MKKVILLLAAGIIFCSHDMFLKMNSFFLEPGQPSALNLFNGTFEKSENVITRTRMQDVTLLGKGRRQHPDSTSWTEKDNVTILNFRAGEPGTWVAGVSIKPNNIELTAAEFNEYLEHDGVLDMLERRKQNNAMDQPAVEKYSKHVKAIFQVGEERTGDWQTPLGYPIEFVPQNNPYELGAGAKLLVRLLRNGQPLPNHLVYAGVAATGHGHSHNQTTGGEHRHDEEKMTTDADGLVSLTIDHDGQWYLRTIHMTLSEERGLTHESNWATLTFEVQQPNHSHGAGIPAGWYWIAGILLLAGLFFFLRK